MGEQPVGEPMDSYSPPYTFGSYFQPSPVCELNPKETAARNKPPLANIPSGALVPVCLVHQHGHDKHGPYNWRETPIHLMTYAHAIQRHLAAWIDGEDMDPESGLPHMAHIAAGCNVVLDAIAHGKFLDDRPPKGRGAELIKEATDGRGT